MAAFLLTSCRGQAMTCPKGWFGELCVHQCHCKRDLECARDDGACQADDTCATSYFGPGCQYYDLATESEKMFFLNDGNDSTCNPSRTPSVELVWTRPFVFHWFRLVVNNAESLDNLSLLLNTNTKCFNARMFPVHRSAVDVKCDNQEPLSAVQLTGPAARSACSLYVTAGRNVALKQPTSQSTNYTYSNFPEQGQPSNAVDGNVDPELNHFSCAHTIYEPNPWWHLQFNRSFILSRLHVYNRNLYQFRLLHFFATTYDDNNVTNVYENMDGQATSVFKFYLMSLRPSTSLNISMRAPGWVCVCEVEAYGEVVCPDGKYGLDCEYDCMCDINQSCHIPTGACSSPCPEDMFGLKCSHNCSSTCALGHCSEHTGACYHCLDGYVGHYCSDECDGGYYGPKCQLTCSSYCLDVCDFQTGACTCVGRRIGIQCDDCPKGYFGELCQQTCPSSCMNNQCDNSTGLCYSCVEGFHGDFCIDVPPSRSWQQVLLLLVLSCMMGMVGFCALKRRQPVSPAEVY
ncbi:hypothetical protein BsWGS_18432 [Bradybaena similaris]